jgi:hypothetical protein
MAKAKPKPLLTTMGAALEIGCPVTYVRWCIDTGKLTPLRDNNGRALLTDAMVETIREYRRRRFTAYEEQHA